MSMNIWRKIPKFKRRVLTLSTLIFCVFLMGAIGWVLIRWHEGRAVSLVDAIYWTVVTMTTLGAYPDGMALHSDLGKLFASLLVTLGIVIVFIGLPLTLTPWLEERMRSVIALKHVQIPETRHIIICGYNDIGKEIREDLELQNVGYVFVEKDRTLIETLAERDVPYVFGDPTDEQVLRRANIDGALSLITVVDDVTNAFICLTAKELNRDIRIVASANEADNTKILQRSGASKVISSKSLTGSLLAQRATGKADIDITGRMATLCNMEIHQHTLNSGSPFAGHTLKEANVGERTGVVILGIWQDGKLTVNPHADTELRAGSSLLVMGTTTQLDKFWELAI